MHNQLRISKDPNLIVLVCNVASGLETPNTIDTAIFKLNASFKQDDERAEREEKRKEKKHALEMALLKQQLALNK